MHGVVVVIGISNLDELDPSDIFFNPLPLFLFLFFSVNVGVASTIIFGSTTTYNISGGIGIVDAIDSSGARSMVVVVPDAIRISVLAGSTFIVGSLGQLVRLRVLLEREGTRLTTILGQ
ncbi:hypothetical protein Scep_012279 [Stephania cephalantha]|uniref:Uncharacterized protein n=1 Tax=Stephania cephalantha TaxID=152367 RepID=A0AAP0JGA3_9MAGN